MPSDDHILQLFDSAASMSRAVSAFLADGWRRDERLLVIVKPRHWDALQDALAERGVPVADAIASNRIVVIDAVVAVADIMVGDAPSETRFLAVVEPVVAQLTADGPARIYGEIVELLAEEGNLAAAAAVEGYWNTLRASHRFTLLCGYHAAHFADERRSASLRDIRDRHTRVERDAADMLGAFLLDQPDAEIADAH